MNTDANLDLLLWWQASRCVRPCCSRTSIAQRTVSTTLRNSMESLPSPVRLTIVAVMEGDGRIDQVAAERPEPCQNAIFRVRARQSAIAGNIRNPEPGRNLPGPAHCAPSQAAGSPSAYCAMQFSLSEYLRA